MSYAPAPHERESTAKCYMCQSWMCNLKTLLVKLALLFTTALIRDFLIKTIYTLRLRHPHLYKALVPLFCTVGTIINSRVKGYQPMWYDIANNINTTECLSYSLVVIPMQHNPQIRIMLTEEVGHAVDTMNRIFHGDSQGKTLMPHV